MYIAIPFEGRVRTLIRSSFVLAKRLSETTYNLSGDAFQMAQVKAEQALVFPDETALEEGAALTDELLMRALPLESFVSVSAEEALPNVLGLLLRTAVADGRISDEELLSVQPALEGRNWRANVAVQVGDVFAYKGALWRCIQAHTTQGGWQPDKTPALWHKVEIVAEGTVRVWEKVSPMRSATWWPSRRRTARSIAVFRRTPRRPGGSRRPRPRCGRRRRKTRLCKSKLKHEASMRAAFVLFPSQGGNIMRDFSIDLVWAKLQMAIAAVGGWLGYFVGGVDGLMTALLILMVMDYVTGVMCAVIDRELSSSVGFRGIFKKVLILMLVGVAHIVDLHVVRSGEALRSAVICFYLSNEGVSVLENAGHLGLPIPEKLKGILAQLHDRIEEADETEDGGE